MEFDSTTSLFDTMKIEDRVPTVLTRATVEYQKIDLDTNEEKSDLVTVEPIHNFRSLDNNDYYYDEDDNIYYN